jgi:hypothetical protein
MPALLRKSAGVLVGLAVFADQVAAQTSTADTASRGIATAEAQQTLAFSCYRRCTTFLD